MRKTTLSLSISLLLATGVVYAEEAKDDSFMGLSVSGSAALTSDYIWRGISQTMGSAAMQGSIDINHETGFYAGVWGSNVEFGNNASVELDIYTGFSNDIKILNHAVTYDIGYLHYDYPMQSSLNFDEIYFGLATSPIDNLNTSLYYYQDLKATGTIGYIDLAADYTLPDWAWSTNISAHYGYYANKMQGADYSDWKVGISKEIGGFGFEFAYTETNLPDGDPASGDNYVFTVSRAFGDPSASASLPEGFETSATATLTTDYMWRGVSQTANGMAFQGSFDLSHESGLYIGAWGSNVQFGTTNPNSLELDVYLGFSRDITIAGLPVTYDIGWLHYDYPLSSMSSNFNEIYFGLATSPIENLNTSVYFYADIAVENDFGVGYLDLAVDYTLPEWAWDITTSAHYGTYFMDTKANTYSDWKLAVAKDISILNIELAYVDASNSNALGLANNSSDARFVATFSTSF